MTRRKTKHDCILEALVRELEDSGQYAIVERNVLYSRRGLDGEFDVLATPKRGLPTYYEVKTTDTREAFQRALRQFARADQAFPQQLRFVYHTPTRQERCYLRRNYKP